MNLTKNQNLRIFCGGGGGGGGGEDGWGGGGFQPKKENTKQ